MIEPQYKHKPLGSLIALSKAIGFPLRSLLILAGSNQKYYSPNKPEIKPNGKIRLTFKVSEPMNMVQKKILHHILHNVVFPDYLQGSIKGRDYINDARLHTGRKVIIHEDISDFFPSIKGSYVSNMWQYFFHFAPEVAQILTKLTTYEGFIPQGASTSPYIANLIFWDREPKLEYGFRQQDLIYSRFVDDIQISSNGHLSRKEIREITTKVYQMIYSLGFTPNRGKRKVESGGNKMTVHNLNVDSDKPTISKSERSKIRAAVFELEKLADISPLSEAVIIKYAQVWSRVAVMARMHPGEASKYFTRLKAIEPKF
jgi:hypothetical protein